MGFIGFRTFLLPQDAEGHHSQGDIGTCELARLTHHITMRFQVCGFKLHWMYTFGP